MVINSRWRCRFVVFNGILNFDWSFISRSNRWSNTRNVIRVTRPWPIRTRGSCRPWAIRTRRSITTYSSYSTNRTFGTTWTFRSAWTLRTVRTIRPWTVRTIRTYATRWTTRCERISWVWRIFGLT